MPDQISTLKFAARAKTIKNTPLVNGEIEYDPQVLLRKYEDELKNLQAKSMNNDLERMIDNTNQTQNESVMNFSEFDNKDVLENQTELDKYKGLLLRQRDIMIAMTARLNNRDETIINLQSEIEMLNQRNIELENELLKNSDEYDEFKNSENKRSASKVQKHSAAAQAEEKLESVKGYSDSLKNGLDLVINVLTKENANIDLGSIAQRLLALQSLSHKLNRTVSDKG